MEKTNYKDETLTTSNAQREEFLLGIEWKKVAWKNVFILLYMQVATIYSLIFTKYTGSLVILESLLFYIGMVGVTAGAHRLWSHRAYKAKWQLRLLLTICQQTAFQSHIYDWVLQHRVHHKFSDTNADPHNSKRGFFFSHVGWFLIRKHPDVKQKGNTLDFSDIKKDPIVMWQRKYYLILTPLVTFLIPTWLPMYFLGVDFWTSWNAGIVRLTAILNFISLVNSVAHRWGYKPYDKTIKPVENPQVAFLTLGEGWHNFHHAFPYDYRTAELGIHSLSPTTAFINFFGMIGWAYDFKMVTDETIRKRRERTGKLSLDHDENQNHIWGWGDKDMKKYEHEDVAIKKGYNNIQ